MSAERVIVTNTALSTYRQCPRKYRNRYVLGLVRKRRATPLRFGSGHHRGLELRVLKPKESDDSIIEIVLTEYGPCPEWADPTDWAVERETLRQLLIGHFQRYSQDNIDMLAVEIPFEIALVDPATGRESRYFVVAGKMDGLGKLPDVRTGLVEYKTVGEDIAPESEYWLRLRCDGQISLYVLAARALGYDVSTVLYDVTRKPTIRLRQKETPEAYSQRLAEDIAARPDYYYQRREVPRLEDDLAEFRRELWQQAQALHESMRHDRWYRNVSKMTCGSCDFADLCLSGTRINPSCLPPGFELLNDPHPELAP